MSAIGPGDWVECVSAGDGGYGDGGFLRIGNIYQVRQVGLFARNRYGVVHPAIKLVGQPERSDRGLEGAYAAKNFRPIYRPKSDFIESLKQPAPEREPEHV